MRFAKYGGSARRGGHFQYLGLRGHQLFRCGYDRSVIAVSVTDIDLQINTGSPTKLLQPLQQRFHPLLPFCIRFCERDKHTDVPHPRGWLLGARSDRPRSRRSDDCSDEIASPHCDPVGQ
jgi:hypothetical protein